MTMQASYDALINTAFGAITLTTMQSKTTSYISIALLDSPSQPCFPQSPMPLLANTISTITQYLVNPNTPCALPSLSHGTAFQQRVWQAMYAIPVGQTKTYGQLALILNSGARAVANACGANSQAILIPCHRVVAKHGLGGFMQSPTTGAQFKRWLLRHEGCVQYD